MGLVLTGFWQIKKLLLYRGKYKVNNNLSSQ